MTLDAYLRDNSISGADFAQRLGISEASLSRIRRGEQNISRDLMQRIITASAGEVSANTLIFPEGEAA